MPGTSDCSVAIKSNWIVEFLGLYVALYIPTALVHELGHLLALTIVGVGGSIYYDPPFGLMTVSSGGLSPMQMVFVGVSGGILAGIFDGVVIFFSDGVASDVAFAHMVTQFMYSAYEGYSSYYYMDISRLWYRVFAVLGILLSLVWCSVRNKKYV